MRCSSPHAEFGSARTPWTDTVCCGEQHRQNQEVMRLHVKDRLKFSKRARVASGGAVATFALLGSGLVAGSAPAVGAEAPEAPTMVKQTSTQESKAKRSAAQKTGASTLRCYRRCWGAVAVANRGAAWGGWYNAPTKYRAKRNAIRQCRNYSDFPRTCRWRVVTLNSCAATAVRIRNGWVVRVRSVYGKPTKRRAVRAALRKCRSDGRSCIRRGWVCTANRR